MSRIVVLGGAESGVGAAVLAKVKGHDVFLSDKGKIKDEYVETLKKWDIPYEEGHHTEELILNADEVVKSPGIPGTVPMVQKLRAQGTHIVSEIEFASRYDPAKKICITGSNGKTTTTSLIYYLLQNAGLNVGLGGNIGKSYAYQVATEHFDYYVLEISSFQLDDVYDFKPDIAIITNITPDHLDRYDHKMENYVAAKFNITKNLTRDDCFIFDSDDDITIGHLDNIILRCKMLPFSQEKEVEQGAFLRDDKIVLRYEEEETDLYLQDNQIRISVLNESNMTITRFYFLIELQDLNGNPLPCTTTGTNVFEGSYGYDLLEGDATRHGRFSFYSFVQPQQEIGRVIMTLTGYRTDEGMSWNMELENRPVAEYLSPNLILPEPEPMPVTVNPGTDGTAPDGSIVVPETPVVPADGPTGTTP